MEKQDHSECWEQEAGLAFTCNHADFSSSKLAQQCFLEKMGDLSNMVRFLTEVNSLRTLHTRTQVIGLALPPFRNRAHLPMYMLIPLPAEESDSDSDCDAAESEIAPLTVPVLKRQKREEGEPEVSIPTVDPFAAHYSSVI